MNVSQKFIDKVEELKHHTKTNIDDIQAQCCPMVKDVYLHYQFEYWYEGYRYNIWEDDVQLYAVKEIPYCYDNETKNVSFQGKMIDLVDQDKVWPFLLFVNGHVVPWSKITIIRDYDYSYLRIDGEKDDYSDSAKMIYFPFGSKDIIYGEDEDYSKDPNIKGIYFDENGYLLQSPEFQKLSVRLEFNLNVYLRIINTWNYVVDGEPTDKYMIDFAGLEDGKVPTLRNMIGFTNYGGIEDSADKLTDKIFDLVNGTFGRFFINADYARTSSYILQMYFEGHVSSLSYAYTKEIDKDKFLDILKNNQPEEPVSFIRDMLISPFDFKFSRDSSYDENIRIGMKIISHYNYSLWNDIFIKESPVKSFTYTGREFKQLSDIRSYVRFSRRHTDLIEDVAMMFVNGKLYEHSIDISYTNNTINIPAFGILDSDVVELIMFTKCNNNVLNVVVPDNVTKVYIHPEYNLNDCYIMDSDIGIGKYDDVPDSEQNRKQYICEIAQYSQDGNYNYIIEFVDPFHYGRTLKIVPKNQFRYYRFKQLESQHMIILPQQFNYCHDVDRYMIFVNGRKIDKTEYTITIMNEYRPFDKLVLYVSTILDEGDRVDIYYVPEYLVEKYKEATVGWAGSIQLTTNYPKLYALSKNTCMIFVNGFKINPMDIKDISMNTICVNTKYKTLSNITVVEYLNGSKEIAKYLYGSIGTIPIGGETDSNTPLEELYNVVGSIIDNDDLYDIGVESDDLSRYLYDQWQLIMDRLVGYFKDKKGTDELTSEEIESAINIIYELFPSLTEADLLPNYKNDYATLRSILYDIVVDYYIQRHKRTTGDVFDYDFEVDQWSEDNIGNKDISLYPDHDKLLDYLLDVDSATEDDVVNEKKYIEP